MLVNSHQHRVLCSLADVGERGLSAKGVEHHSGVKHPGASLNKLRDKGLVEYRRPRLSVRVSSGHFTSESRWYITMDGKTFLRHFGRTTTRRGT